MIKIALLIGTGSFLGGILRYGLSTWVQSKYNLAFPMGTLVVNLAGCFLIGLVFAMAERGHLAPEARLFLATGLLGGFTTFSAFSNETLGLLREGAYSMAFGYVAASLLLGVGSTWVGYVVGR